jgi:hypothetical protein
VKELIGFYKVVFAIMIGFFASAIGIIVHADMEKITLMQMLAIPFAAILFFGIMVITVLITREIKKLEEL